MSDYEHANQSHARAHRPREWLAALPLVAIVAWVAWSVAASGTATTATAPAPASSLAQADVAPAAPIAPVAEQGPDNERGTVAAGELGDSVDARSATVGIAASADSDWLHATAASTGIPIRVLASYTGASLELRDEQPGCHLGWTTLAAIGSTESAHGTLGGTTVLPDGTTSRPILGPQLDGSAFEPISDTDGGRWDGDESWDRAVGPMQFIPGTWSVWGADGNADGVADPNQVDDAVLATARYLCNSGDLSTGAGWQAAIYSYNHSDRYVATVSATATALARGSRT